MKRKFALILAAVLLLILLVTVFSGCESRTVLNVYNWGEYIDKNVLKQFEEETGIKIRYSTFASNEEMYAKLKAGGGNYDVIFPSDYMVQRLIEKDMLAELNYDNIPNFSYIMEDLKNMSYDPGNTYSVPYMWGTVGILYNKALTGVDIDSWTALWDEKYAQNLFMYDSSRDSFAPALILAGYSVNERSDAALEEATQLLIQQKPLVLAYLTDEVQDKMVQGEAALALVYSGYVSGAVAENEDLRYVIPKEGSNVWFDAVCIPKSSKNKEAAELFINFLCRTDIALANVEEICYATPHQGAYDLLDPEEQNNPVNYPSSEDLARCEVYVDLGDYNAKYDDAFLRVKG
ncbi:MAG: ABC transporter substrate-binding protein [Christensenellales bacterium]|jgi:spermidine/putrescine transport system substrate-binding protein